MQPPRIGNKWLARPGIYLAGAALVATLIAAACGGEKSSYPTVEPTPPAATATPAPYQSETPSAPYPTATPEAATPPTAVSEPTKPPEFRPLINADGRYDPKEWKGAKSIDIQGGKIFYKNDSRFLYLLLDVTADTGNDSAAEGNFPASDGFGIAFDVDNNGKGTPMRDVNYSLFRGTEYKLGKQVLLPPESPLGWSAVGPTSSELGVGFSETDNSSAPHRYLELKIPLEEIHIEPNVGSSYQMAVMVYLWSKNPGFYIVPPNQSSFEGLPKLRLEF